MPANAMPAACSHRPARSRPDTAASTPPAASVPAPARAISSLAATSAPASRARPRRGERLAGKVAEEQLPLLEIRRDDRLRQLEQLQRPLVLDAVVDARPLASALNQPLLAQQREVLRRCAGVELERRLQVAHRTLALTQELQQADPHGMPEHAEELRLQRKDRRL